MLKIFKFFIFFYVFVLSLQNILIPDIDHFELGYNSYLQNPNPSKTYFDRSSPNKKILKLSYDNSNFADSFSIPDELIFEKTGLCSKVKQYIITSESDYVDFLKQTTKLGKEYDNVSVFTGSPDFKRISELISKKHQIIFLGEYICSEYELSLKATTLKQSLSDEFVQEIGNLIELESQWIGTNQDYFNVFDVFGTHFCSQMFFGGKFLFENHFSWFNYTEILKTSYLSEKELKEMSTNYVEYTLANPSINSKDWAKKVKKNPFPYEFKLEKISKLINILNFPKFQPDHVNIVSAKMDFYFTRYCNFFSDVCNGLRQGFQSITHEIVSSVYDTRSSKVICPIGTFLLDVSFNESPASPELLFSSDSSHNNPTECSCDTYDNDYITCLGICSSMTNGIKVSSGISIDGSKTIISCPVGTLVASCQFVHSRRSRTYSLSSSKNNIMAYMDSKRSCAFYTLDDKFDAQAICIPKENYENSQEIVIKNTTRYDSYVYCPNGKSPVGCGFNLTLEYSSSKYKVTPLKNGCSCSFDIDYYQVITCYVVCVDMYASQKDKFQNCLEGRFSYGVCEQCIDSYFLNEKGICEKKPCYNVCKTCTNSKECSICNECNQDCNKKECNKCPLQNSKCIPCKPLFYLTEEGYCSKYSKVIDANKYIEGNADGTGMMYSCSKTMDGCLNCFGNKKNCRVCTDDYINSNGICSLNEGEGFKLFFCVIIFLIIFCLGMKIWIIVKKRKANLNDGPLNLEQIDDDALNARKFEMGQLQINK